MARGKTKKKIKMFFILFKTIYEIRELRDEEN